MLEAVRLFLIIALGLAPSMPSRAPAAGNEQVSAQVTVYGAAWCSACKSLEASLKSRGIPFDAVDVDANPGAYSIAKKATGTNAIPITNILRGPMQSWIVGANPDAVEKAYRGD
jgi:mycoredoxin